MKFYTIIMCDAMSDEKVYVEFEGSYADAVDKAEKMAKKYGPSDDGVTYDHLVRENFDSGLKIIYTKEGDFISVQESSVTMKNEETLEQLLDKLRESQSWCPYCSGEKVCDANCILKELWFERINDGQDT